MRTVEQECDDRANQRDEQNEYTPENQVARFPALSIKIDPSGDRQRGNDNNQGNDDKLCRSICGHVRIPFMLVYSWVQPGMTGVGYPARLPMGGALASARASENEEDSDGTDDGEEIGQEPAEYEQPGFAIRAEKLDPGSGQSERCGDDDLFGVALEWHGGLGMIVCSNFILRRGAGGGQVVWGKC